MNSGFREAEALSLEVDLIPKDNADSHVRREKVLALWYEHVRRAAKLASRWAARKFFMVLEFARSTFIVE